MQRLQCMDVWGGFEAIDTGVSVPGLDAWVFSKPYEDAAAGGDLHYLSLCSAGKLARVLLADVSGHGHGVADLSDRLYRTMREHIETVDQSEMARLMNDAFTRDTDDGKFATAVIVSHKDGRLVTVNAGHPAPLWYQAAQDRWTWLEPTCREARHDAAGLPLGVIDGTDYHQFAVPVGPGDAVLLFTDALTESRRDGTGPMLGAAGLMKLAEALDPADPGGFGRSLLGAAAAYRGGRDADDDLTLVSMLFHGESDGTLAFG